MSNKRYMLKKTLYLGFLSAISKFFGIIRDILRIGFLGIGTLSDAFAAAYKIPNILKKPLAGGALSTSFIPTLVKLLKENKTVESDKVISGLLLINSLFMLLICLLIFIFPKLVIILSAYGFLSKPLELCSFTSLIKILIFFIFFNSISNILSGVMQAKSNFTVVGFGPIILNIMQVVILIMSRYFNLSIYSFALLLLLSVVCQSLFFLYCYFKLGFRLRCPDLESLAYIKGIIFKFLPCTLAISTLKFNVLIDEQFGSTLSSGTYTIIGIAFKFTAIVLHIVGTNFAVILLPYLCDIAVTSRQKFDFYILKTVQFVIWIVLPITLIIMFFSYDLMYTIFYKFSNSKFDLINIGQASNVLIGYSMGLLFYAINKILLNTYYSLNSMYWPAAIAVLGIIFNILLNIMLVDKFGAFGLAFATSIVALLQTILFLLILKLKFNLHLSDLLLFCVRYITQLFFASMLFYIIYQVIYLLINNYFNSWLKVFFLHELGLWLWITPLILLLFILLYKTRRIFGIKIYILS